MSFEVLLLREATLAGEMVESSMPDRVLKKSVQDFVLLIVLPTVKWVEVNIRVTRREPRGSQVGSISSSIQG